MKRTILALTLAFTLPALSAHAADKGAPTVAPGSAKHAVATCRDGKTYYSTSNEHRGACAKHGGVQQWSDGTEVKSNARKGEYR